ncbi:MAG: hypothetical protein KJ726_07400, partial [Verrucomicrobia bacterium]|nr:hypothetical protein [Verrucomicrobiota bacterium]
SFTVVRQLWSHVSGRFLLPAVIPAFLLGLGWLWTRPSARRVTIAVLMIVALIHAGYSTFFGWAEFARRVIPESAAVLAILSAALYALLRFNRRAWLTALIVIASLAAALTALQKERDHLRYKALKQSMVLHWMENHWADGAEVLDDPATPRHLAVTAGIDFNGDNWFLYYFLGRRFQNTMTYISPTRSGRILDARSWEELYSVADHRLWQKRVVNAGVSHIVCLPPWSLELEIIKRRPGLFRQVAGDSATWGVYTIRPPRPKRSEARPGSR